jgi:hypothetical protein
MMQRLDLLGRKAIGYGSSGIDTSVVWEHCIGPFFQAGRENPELFLRELRRLIEHDTGGFATYGASELMVEALGTDVQTPDALAILDAAIAFKRDRGLPSAMLKGYEWIRWQKVHGPCSW